MAEETYSSWNLVSGSECVAPVRIEHPNVAVLSYIRPFSLQW